MSAELKRRIDGGESFDVVIITPALIDELIKTGRVAGASRAPLARSGMALAMRRGAEKPDVHTMEALTGTLLAARSIAFAKEGSGGIFFNALVKRLGLVDRLTPKFKPTTTGDEVSQAVARGEADLGVLPLSESCPSQVSRWRAASRLRCRTTRSWLGGWPPRPLTPPQLGGSLNSSPHPASCPSSSRKEWNARRDRRLDNGGDQRQETGDPALRHNWPGSHGGPEDAMRRLTSILALLIGGWIAAAASSVEIRAGQTDQPSTAAAQTPQAVFSQYCVTCHNQRLRTAGLALDTLDAARPSTNAEVWERVIGKLRARLDAAARTAASRCSHVSVPSPPRSKHDIDRAWAAQPNPGPHRRRAPAQSHRIHQRHSRPVRARPRRQAAAAGRRDR